MFCKQVPFLFTFFFKASSFVVHIYLSFVSQTHTYFEKEKRKHSLWRHPRTNNVKNWMCVAAHNTNTHTHKYSNHTNKTQNAEHIHFISLALHFKISIRSFCFLCLSTFLLNFYFYSCSCSCFFHQQSKVQQRIHDFSPGERVSSVQPQYKHTKLSLSTDDGVDVREQRRTENILNTKTPSLFSLSAYFSIFTFISSQPNMNEQPRMSVPWSGRWSGVRISKPSDEVIIRFTDCAITPRNDIRTEGIHERSPNISHHNHKHHHLLLLLLFKRIRW